MLGFGARRSRQFQRIIKNGKVTILCLFLTFIVLRENLGAEKFGTPEQDFNEIRHTFIQYGKRAEPSRVLEEAHTTTAAGNNYAAFDINKIFVDEEEDGKKDPNKPYSIGPKISDWDEQRG